MKQFILKLNAEIIDQENNRPVITQELAFSGHAPAIHDAISKMGSSFVYGLGVSLSKNLLDGDKEDKKV